MPSKPSVVKTKQLEKVHDLEKQVRLLRRQRDSFEFELKGLELIRLRDNQYLLDQVDAARAESRALEDALVATEKARDEAKSVVAGMREAVLEFEIAPPVGAEVFTAHKEGKIYALLPDKVEGLFQALDTRWKSEAVRRWSEELRTGRDRASSAEARMAELQKERDEARQIVKDLMWTPAPAVLSCVYCGQQYPPGTPSSGASCEVLTEHIRICSSHPMRGLEEKLAAADKIIQGYDQELMKARRDRDEARAELATYQGEGADAWDVATDNLNRACIMAFFVGLLESRLEKLTAVAAEAVRALLLVRPYPGANLVHTPDTGEKAKIDTSILNLEKELGK